MICLHDGFYKGACFPFILRFPSTYPSEPPIFQFPSKPSHPLITDNGILALEDLQLEKWRHLQAKENYPILTILQSLKGAFSHRFPDLIEDLPTHDKMELSRKIRDEIDSRNYEPGADSLFSPNQQYSASQMMGSVDLL